jgi:D-tyrosyl-tRNA(Tyr) deacylase
MRVVIQRVNRATISVSGRQVAAIQKGLLVFLGIQTTDTEKDVIWLSRKIVHMRIFADPAGAMNLSVKDINGALLLVSQFTLHALANKGNRPSFIHAAPREKAIPLYEQMIRQLSADSGTPVATGVFGADMQIELVNDGPVTILLDSRQ